MTLNIVLEQIGNSYRINVLKDETTLETRHFYVFEFKPDYVIQGPSSPYDPNVKNVFPLCVAHDELELKDKLKDILETHVSGLYERFRNSENLVIDKTKEMLLKDWKEPVIFPDD